MRKSRASLSQKKKQWREFEEAVALIERSLATKGAKITSPDSIIDVDGTDREIDVSIRHNIGSSPVLIILECRMRKARQDKRWIEELASKRASVHADVIIGVSSAGFSKASLSAAKRNGVQLRVLSSLTPDDVLSWCQITEFSLYTPRLELISAHLFFGTSLDSANELGETFTNPRAKCYAINSDAPFISMEDLFNRWVKSNSEFVNTGIDHTRRRETYMVKLTGPPLYLCESSQRVLVTDIEWTIERWVEESSHPRGNIQRYAPPGETGFEHIQFPIAAGGVKLTLAFTRNVGTEETSISLHAAGSAGLPRTHLQ